MSRGEPRLRTERFVLRRFGAGDAAWMADLDADPAVRRYTGGGSAPSLDAITEGPLSRVLAWHERSTELGYWWIHDRASAPADTPPLGWVHLRPVIWAADPLTTDAAELELGWRLHRRAWGRGVAMETAAALAADAFGRLGTRRIAAVAMPDNDASFRVMERLGMRFAGIRRLHGDVVCIEYALEAAGGAADRPSPPRVRIRDHRPVDAVAVSRLLREAFDGPGEARLVEHLSETGRLALMMVAEDAASDAKHGPDTAPGDLLGVAAISPAAAPAGMACLGPVAVRADVREHAIGARLVRAALRRAADRGVRSAAVIGDPGWYPRFGFEPAGSQGFRCRWDAGEAFMVRPLEGGGLPAPGPVAWDEAFDALDD